MTDRELPATASAAAVAAPRYKPMKYAKAAFVLSLALVPAFAKADPPRPYTFVGNCNPVRILSSTKMDSALRAISAKANKKLELFSCYRSQGKQDSLLALRGCAAKGGCADTASRSQHTYGIAADFTLTGGSGNDCHLMNQVRKDLFGGRGGIGSYGGTRGHGASVHFDIRDNNAAWVGCSFLKGDNAITKSAVVDTFLASTNNYTQTATQPVAQQYGYVPANVGAGPAAGGPVCTDVVCDFWRFLFGS